MNTLLEILKEVKGCQFVGLTYVSTLKLKKRGNPFANDNICKLVSTNCQFNYDYEKAVKNRISKSGGDPNEFTGEKLPWGNWLSFNKLIEHKDQIYVRFYKLAKVKSDIVYFINGNIASAEEVKIIKEFLPATNYNSQKQSEAGLEDNQVMLFNVNIDNIKRISINGKVYNVK